MRSSLAYILGTLCLLPTAACADEPAKGTLIMISSVGGWVIFSSVGMAMRERRRPKPDKTPSAQPPSTTNA